jgi:hypothetical protein
MVPSLYDPARDLINRSGIATSTSATSAVSSTERTGSKRIVSDPAVEIGEMVGAATPGVPGSKVGSRTSRKRKVNG